MGYLIIVLITVIAYLLGSINTSIIVSKFKGTDIREHGSGNAGLTNTLRIFGKGAALVVLIGDLLKGVIAILLARLVVGQYVMFERAAIAASGTLDFVKLEMLGNLEVIADQIAGIAVVIGHIFPIFYKFKGGKGVLTSAVVILMMKWQIGLICLAVFIVIVAVTRYVSLGSVMAALTFPSVVLVSYRIPWIGDCIDLLLFGLILAFLVIAKHHGNISRLLKGEERRLSFGSKKVEAAK